jgi:hypothetical protein
MKTIRHYLRFGALWGLLLVLAFGYAPVAQAGPEPAGWYVGDIHVHRSCGTAPVTEQSIFSTEVSSNLAIISDLADMGNAEVQDATTDLPLVTGSDDTISTPGHIYHWDAEWHWDATYTQYAHQALGGHIVALGLTNAYQIWSEMTSTIFNWTHAQGGIGGFAHFEYLDIGAFPTTLTCCTPVEYPSEVALGACDFISEDVLGSDAFLDAYYKLLNCGFRPGFAAGSDYPCGSVVGPMVTYAQMAGGQLAYSNWVQAILKGRTVIARDGHHEFLNLVVNGTNTPGDEIQLSAPGSVSASVTWTANSTYSGSLELVCNGVVVGSEQATVTSNSPVTLTATVTLPRSGWICARRMDYPGASHEVHTAAIYVTVNQAPVRASVADAEFYVQWMENLLTNVAPGGVWNWYFPTTLAQTQARYQAALAVYQNIAAEAMGELSVATTALPYATLNAPYSAVLNASGGYNPYSWSIVGGSLPAGLAFNPATAAITGIPTATGTFDFTVQVTDSSSPMQTATGSLGLLVTPVPVDTLWPSTVAPVNPDNGADDPLELGLKFQSAVSGTVTGIRFYKAPANVGLHVGNLWSSSGTLLGSVNFSSETPSGWQQALFSSPISIVSNTTYVASYHANFGSYSDDGVYFRTSGYTNLPLHALENSTSSPNGVYIYSSNSVFPTVTWNSDNYWVDLLFVPAVEPSLAFATAYLPGGWVGDAYSASVNVSGGTAPYTWSITSGSLPSGLTLNAAEGLISGAPTTTSSSTFTVQVTDSSKPVQTVSQQMAISVFPNVLGVTSIWTNWPVPGAPDTGPDSALEIGVKFRSDIAGSITGVRFFKASANTGTHVGNLWTTNGTLLATATFTNESASGWQQVNFSSAVAITPNTVYVASYHALNGHYSEDDNFFVTNVDNPPLHALASGVAGGDGVYTYGASSVFPSSTWEAGNYWVDVVFQPAGPPPTLVSIAVTPANPTNVVGKTTQFAATGTYSDNSTQNLTSQATWASSQTSVAAINTAGLASALTAGTSTISAMLGTVSGSTLLTIQPAPTLVSIAVSPSDPTNVVGATAQFSATGTYSDNSTQNLTSQVTWASTQTSVATINTAGLASALTTGTSTISATLGTVSGSTLLTVQPAPLTMTTTSLPGGTVSNAYSASLAASGGTTPYAWSITSGSLPGGLTLNATNGLISGVPTNTGTSSFTVNVSDASNPVQNATNALSLSITAPSTFVSIWPATAVPGTVDGGPDSAVELGVKFRSDVSGSITGIRFYKAAANTNTHIGNLWTTNGTRLASATFTNESASGWQQVTLTNAVFITSNTIYVASYHSLDGHYSADVNFFAATNVDNPPLHALATGTAGGNGVYTYGTSSAYPSSTWDSANYWVDVAFRAGPAPLTMTTTSLAGGTVSNAYSATLAASGGTPPYTWSITTGSLPGGLTLNATSGLISGVPTNTGTFSFTVKVTDAGSPAQTATGALSISITSASAILSIWPATAVPGTADGGPDSAVELGVKFRSDVSGSITGIRFYKAASNTNTHIGNLWNTNGTRLASATFTNESASGWQQVIFTNAVAITSNTVYVASYHAVDGHYSADINFFASTNVDNPPLHALANGVAGGDGVYTYGTSSAYPSSTWESANYWVDVTFKSGP